MKKYKRIFITGGAGYVGSVLVPRLISEGYQVTVLDLMIYGEGVSTDNKNLTLIKGDIRDLALLEKTIPGHDALIHLACISNDPSFELNPILGKTINLDAFEPLVKISRDKNISRFIYASSSSVYGVKEEENVHEGMALEPLTDYSKYKAECEEILMRYKTDKFVVTAIRPATVCGYSPRQRLDVIVNILTNLSYHKRAMTVLGGDQLRPNIHIDDMVDAYCVMLSAPENLINGEIFNVGYENQTVNELSKIVKKVVGSDVVVNTMDSNDSRSYHISSEKIKKILGFKPKKTIEMAVEDLVQAFKEERLIDPLNNSYYYNIKRMQDIKLS
jgi:nucleoside-diphosphate-sugar epimerase